MRSRSTSFTLTGLLGCVAVVLGLIPAAHVATARPTTVAPATVATAAVTTATATPALAARPALTTRAVKTRLAALERQADHAGRAAQIADEALLRHRTHATRAAAARAQAHLRALADRQTPELTRLMHRLQALGVRPDAPRTSAATVATAALVRRTRAVRAVSYARRHIGDPYRFADSGPHAFDCSGLTMRAYSAVHVGIGGHSATAQWRKAQRHHRLVPWKHRRRGDLIFYGRPGAVYHVAMYAGHGWMIEAPYPGKQVRQVPVRDGDRLGMVARPTGSHS